MNFWEFLDRNSDGIGGVIMMIIILGFLIYMSKNGLM